MHILITGANGFLGSHLVHYFNAMNTKVTATGRGFYRDVDLKKKVHYINAELTDESQVTSLIQTVQPDVIIHNAAMSKPNDCHTRRDECLKINVEATRYLLNAATQISTEKNIHFIFFSTDYIFGENGPHAEEDIPGPLNFYGESKWMAEKVVTAAKIPTTIIRPVFIYGPERTGVRSGFVQWVKNSLEKNESVKVVSDEARTPTFVGDICKGVQAIIDKKKTGVFHLAGSEIISPAEMAIATANLLGLDADLIEVVKGATLNQPVLRARKSGLTIHKAMNELNYHPISFEEGLKKTFPVLNREKFKN
ncbi:MAG: SDR family oxidoreductase [Bacteroidetes bacterium]|nr:SDR family oxidoreductase [Bacteroidota bacterium]